LNKSLDNKIWFKCQNFARVVIVRQYVNLLSFIKLKTVELNKFSSLLKNLNIENILKRGFVLLKDKKGEFIKKSEFLNKNENDVFIQFHKDLIKAKISVKK